MAASDDVVLGRTLCLGASFRHAGSYLVPYALLICLMLFFAGSVMVYLRVNLGFLWAVGAHALNNVPAVFMITLVLMQS